MSEFSPIDDIVVAKFATNVLSSVENDGSEHLDPDVFDMAGESIQAARETGKHVVVVTSAAIAAGMQETGTKPRPSKITHMHELQYLSGVGWLPILNEWSRVLPEVSVVGIQITSHELEDDVLKPERQELLRTIYTTLAHGNIPLLNENDPITHREISFGDNDILAGMLVAHIGNSALFGSGVELMLVSDVDGIYVNSDDPTTLVKEISDLELVRSYIRDPVAAKANSSGGGLSKIVAAEKARVGGVETYVVSGFERDIIQRGLAREIGTRMPLAA
jgi:glutamate 5-kinase